jgi:hypothetical protein
MAFAPIRLDDYVRKHLKRNPRDKEPELRAQLKEALEAFKGGTGCQHCGAPIWVIGSSQVGHMCFTCITGSADNSEDYEIDEACVPSPRRGPRPSPRSRAPSRPPDTAGVERGGGEITEEDVPF